MYSAAAGTVDLEEAARAKRNVQDAAARCKAAARKDRGQRQAADRVAPQRATRYRSPIRSSGKGSSEDRSRSDSEAADRMHPPPSAGTFQLPAAEVKQEQAENDDAMGDYCSLCAGARMSFDGDPCPCSWAQVAAVPSGPAAAAEPVQAAAKPKAKAGQPRAKASDLAVQISDKAKEQTKSAAEGQVQVLTDVMQLAAKGASVHAANAQAEAQETGGSPLDDSAQSFMGVPSMRTRQRG